MLTLFVALSGCAARPSDETIATEIKARFFVDPLVKAAEVSVVVARGEVTLAGTAGSTEVELQAFQIASTVPGVRRVRDQIALAEEQPQEGPPGAAAPGVIASAANVSTNSEAYVPSPPPPPEEIRIVERTVQLPAPPPVVIEQPVAAPVPAEVIVVEESHRWNDRPPADRPEREIDRSPREPHKPASEGSPDILGAGATHPSAVISKWLQEFKKAEKHAPLQYQSIGSGAGIKQLLAGTIDFAVSDLPITAEQLKVRPVWSLPALVEGVAVICNIPGHSGELRLSGRVLADIYLGKIRTWNDRAIVALNPTSNLPPEGITLVYRSDSTGVTQLFTEFLSGRSAEWRALAGAAPTVRWPTAGLGANGHGVSALVKQIRGSIGYVEVAHALQNKIPMVALDNRNGAFVMPEQAALTAAAVTAITKYYPVWSGFTKSLVDAEGPKSYPICTLASFLIPEQIEDRHKQEVMASFLEWMLKEGQAYVAAFGLAPLPPELVRAEREFARDRLRPKRL